MNLHGVQPTLCQLPEGDGGGIGGFTGGMVRGSLDAKLLAELAQLLSGNVSVFGLEAQSMLLAQVFDHAEIRARLAPIQAFRHFRQNEAAGGAVLSEGNHAGRTGWSNVATKSRTERRRALLTAIIRQEAAGAVEIGQGRGGTASPYAILQFSFDF